MEIKIKMLKLAAAASLVLASEASIAATILLGADYLSTTQATFGGIPFVGNPIGPGYDTIVKRLADCDINLGANGSQCTIDIEMLALSLQGELNPDLRIIQSPTIQSVGSMTIQSDGTGQGGLFDSSFNVFFEFSDDGGNSWYDGSLDLAVNNAPWSTTPSPLTLLVTGQVGDGMANNHRPKEIGQFDFFPGIEDLVGGDKQYAEMCHANPADPTGDHLHCVETAMVPVPAAFWLFGSGLLGLVGMRKKLLSISAHTA